MGGTTLVLEQAQVLVYLRHFALGLHPSVANIGRSSQVIGLQGHRAASPLPLPGGWRGISHPWLFDFRRAMQKVRDSLRRHAAAWRLYAGALNFLALYGAGSCLSFGVHILLARMIGAASYGHFAYAASWMAFLLVACTIGAKPTMLRFAAAYLARQDWGQLRSLLRVATRCTALASTMVVVVALLVVLAMHGRLDEAGITLMLVALAMPFTALGEVWSAAIRGLGAVSRSQWPAMIAQHLLFGACLLGLFVMAGLERSAVTAAGAFLLATVGTTLLAGALLRAQIPAPVRLATPAAASREWAGVAGNNLVISLLQATRGPLMIVFAGAHVDAMQLAYLVAAARLANIATQGVTGIAGFAAPLIARCHALDDMAELQRLARQAARGSLAFALAVALVLVLAGRQLLGLFGPGFESAYLPLLVLLCGELAAAAVGPVGYYLTMTGRQQHATRIEAVCSALAIGLSLVLIPRYGILGTAIAVGLVGASRNLLMAVVVQRQLGLRSVVH